MIVLVLAIIAAAEYVTIVGTPELGMVTYSVLLLALLLQSSLAARESSRRLYLALALVPILRIVNLAMPLSEFTEPYQYLIVSIPLFVAALVCIRILDFDRHDVGLRMGNVPLQLLLALTGVGLGFVEYYIVRPEPLVSSLTWTALLVPCIIFLVATGFVEELTFRGVMQRAAEGIGWWGWIYVALVYSVVNIGHLSAVHGIFALAVGIFFGFVVQRTRSLLGVILCHGIINILVYLILPNLGY